MKSSISNRWSHSDECITKLLLLSSYALRWNHCTFVLQKAVERMMDPKYLWRQYITHIYRKVKAFVYTFKNVKETTEVLETRGKVKVFEFLREVWSLYKLRRRSVNEVNRPHFVTARLYYSWKKSGEQNIFIKSNI